MKVLITGANGLLGRELCQTLSASHDITALVHSAVVEQIPGVNYQIADLSERLDFSMLPTSIDVVFHLAQSSKFRDFPGGIWDTFNVNTRSTLDLLEYCRIAGGKQFFLASTGGVYGEQTGPISEAGLLIPPSEIGFYFASKLSSEMFCSTYRQVFDVTVLRFFFMYGPRQRSDMFLPRLVLRVINGDPISMGPNGGISLNPILVDDVSRVLANLMGRKLPEVLNIGGPDIVSIEQIADEIGQLVNKVPIFEAAQAAPDIIADISSLKNILGDIELSEFRDGLELLVRSITSRL